MAKSEVCSRGDPTVDEVIEVNDTLFETLDRIRSRSKLVQMGHEDVHDFYVFTKKLVSKALREAR